MFGGNIIIKIKGSPDNEYCRKRSTNSKYKGPHLMKLPKEIKLREGFLSEIEWYLGRRWTDGHWFEMCYENSTNIRIIFLVALKRKLKHLTVFVCLPVLKAYKKRGFRNLIKTNFCVITLNSAKMTLSLCAL